VILVRLRVPVRSAARLPEVCVGSRAARLANERAFLAWLRAASGLLLVGLTLWGAQTGPAARWGQRVAEGCVVVAVGLVGIGATRWWRCERAMARAVPLPRGTAFGVLALGAFLLALFAGLRVV
jgi:uncharacterized membrane protein YidH (DUF202 family)